MKQEPNNTSFVHAVEYKVGFVSNLELRYVSVGQLGLNFGRVQPGQAWKFQSSWRRGEYEPEFLRDLS